MTAYASSPATYSFLPSLSARFAGSARTYREELPVPKSEAACRRLLAETKKRMVDPAETPFFAGQLARFLGVNSSAWSWERRVELRGLLVAAGEIGMAAVLEAVARRPLAEVTDEVQAVLTTFARESPPLLQILLERLERDASPSARASIVMALGHADPSKARTPVERALEDPDPEVRDAAALALTRVGDAGSRSVLLRRRGREHNPIVRASIEDAIAEIAAT